MKNLRLLLLTLSFFPGYSPILSQIIIPGELVINEFMAANDDIIADQDGEYDDWIELYNNTNNPLNLSGLYMTDNLNSPAKWALPDTILPPDSYLIIWADNDTVQEGLHAYFRLGEIGEFLWIGYINGTVVDSVTFGPQAQNLSYGRFPNGTGNFEFLPPTYASVNVQFETPIDTIPPGAVVINEFLAENDATVADQSGEFDDWIELHNTTSNDLSLSRVFLSDTLGYPGKWAFPDTFIAANGYLIIWADGHVDQAGLHANFRLSRSGEALFLGYPDKTVIDSLTFGVQLSDTTFGRFPNGDGPFGRMLPTFSAQNSGFIVATRIESSLESIDIRMYPNPVSQELFFESSKAINSDLTIFSPNGMQVHRQSIKGESVVRVDMRGYSPGLYLVRIGAFSYGKVLVAP